MTDKGISKLLEVAENDCNSKELARLLVGSIQQLLDLGQWNAFLRVQAIDNPFKFIEDVATFADLVVKEDEGKGNFHLRITGVTVEGDRNKIACIKSLRFMFGFGLADAKSNFERLPMLIPNSSTVSNFFIQTHGFISEESLKESAEWREFQNVKDYLKFEIVRLKDDKARTSLES